MSTIITDLISHLQCGEPIAANDAVYIDSSDGKIYKFDPTDDTQTFAGIAKEAGALNDFIRVSQSGRIKGFTGLIPGAFVYASVTVPGSFQLVEPAPSQKVILGIAKSATELIINGGLGIKPGGDGGGGGLDVFYIENMEGLANVSDFATGNNATFLGGGTLQGTLELDELTPISGLKSLKYTQAAGSLNDYFASPLIEIDEKQQNNTQGMTLYFTYDGNDNDMNFVVWDVTNNQRLSSEVAFVKKTGKAQRYSLSFYVPDSCTQIRWGAQVLVENIGAELLIDDVEMTSNPFVVVNTEGRKLSYTFSNNSATVNVNQGQGEGDLSLITILNNTQIRVNQDTEVVAIVRSNVEWQSSNTGRFRFAVSATGGMVSVGTDNTNPGSAVTTWATATTSGFLPAGAILNFSVSQTGTVSTSNISLTGSITFKARTESIVAPTDQVTERSIKFRWRSPAQATEANLSATGQIGDYVTGQYAAGSNAPSQSTTRPTQTDADMSVNGFRIFARTFEVSSSAAQPSRVVIKIAEPNQLSSCFLSGKDASGNNVGLNYVLFSNAAGTTFYERGMMHQSFDPSTGLLTIDAGASAPKSSEHSFTLISGGSTTTSAYITFTASKLAQGVAIPTPLVAYLKDVKPSGTPGGTFTAGAWQTRTLNTVEGDAQIVSLNANQFTLGPGKYEIEVEAPGHFVGPHKSVLYNVTDAVNALIGSSERAEALNTAVSTKSKIIGTLSLTNNKTFEVRHRCGNTLTSNGFGIPSSFDVNEIYTQVKIKKIG